MHKFGLELDVFPDTGVYRYLDDVGDGSGEKQAIGNYAVTPKAFLIAPPSTQTFEIRRLIILIRGMGPFRAEAYGPGQDPLAVGIRIFRRSPVVGDTDLTDGIPIQSQGAWMRDPFDVDPADEGPGDDFVGIRWTFGKAGAPLILRGVRGDTLEVLLNDDFTHCVEHTFKAHGVIKP